MWDFYFFFENSVMNIIFMENVTIYLLERYNILKLLIYKNSIHSKISLKMWALLITKITKL